MADHQVIGKMGRVTGTIAPGRLGEVAERLGFKIVTGKGTLVIPGVQTVPRISLDLLTTGASGPHQWQQQRHHRCATVEPILLTAHRIARGPV